MNLQAKVYHRFVCIGKKQYIRGSAAPRLQASTGGPGTHPPWTRGARWTKPPDTQKFPRPGKSHSLCPPGWQALRLPPLVWNWPLPSHPCLGLVLPWRPRKDVLTNRSAVLLTPSIISEWIQCDLPKTQFWCYSPCIKSFNDLSQPSALGAGGFLPGLHPCPPFFLSSSSFPLPILQPTGAHSLHFQECPVLSGFTVFTYSVLTAKTVPSAVKTWLTPPSRFFPGIFLWSFSLSLVESGVPPVLTIVIP